MRKPALAADTAGSSVSINPCCQSGANALTHDILAAIRSAPGCVAGYWLEPVDGHGLSFVVFETEVATARSFASRSSSCREPCSPPVFV
jgi:hypothetical protein